MPVLYNCKHSGDLYRITKFNSDMNVESSYLTDGEACDCPAGVRPTCRHRQMLPKFLQREHVGDEWFFDFDRGGWVQGAAIPELTGLQEEQILMGFHNPPPGVTMGALDAAQEDWDRHVAELPDGLEKDEATFEMQPLPKGVTMITLDHPDRVADVHNAIADAVREPTHIKRRF